MRSALLGVCVFAATMTLLAGAAGPAHARKKKVADPTEAAPKVDAAKVGEAARKAQAQKLVLEARTEFEKGSYKDAVGKFEEAYRLFPVPKMLYNIGITYEALRKKDRAVCALERFVAEAPDADPALRTDAAAKISKMKPQVGYVEVTAPEGAVLFIDGEEHAVAPAKHALCAELGRHRVVALVAGVAPVGVDVSVSAKGPVKVALDPASNTAKILSSPEDEKVVAAGKPEDQPARGKPIFKKWWFWTAVGGVVVVGTTATVLGVSLRGPNVMPPAADFGPFPIFQR